MTRQISSYHGCPLNPPNPRLPPPVVPIKSLIAAPVVPPTNTLILPIFGPQCVTLMIKTIRTLIISGRMEKLYHLNCGLSIRKSMMHFLYVNQSCALVLLGFIFITNFMAMAKCLKRIRAL